jgi:AIG2-like family
VTLYAAYAANLSPHEMARRCPHSPLRGTGWLVGWRLTFGGEDKSWEGALATVVEDHGSQVFVALYDVAPADEDTLDLWEGASLGLYRKMRVLVETLDGAITATSYVLDAFEGGLPSSRYVTILADAAESAGAPDDYTAELRRRPSKDVEL